MGPEKKMRKTRSAVNLVGTEQFRLTAWRRSLLGSASLIAVLAPAEVALFPFRLRPLIQTGDIKASSGRITTHTRNAHYGLAETDT